MAKRMKIAASLYSFQLEYLNHEWSFEDCMQLASMTVGDKGVEIVGPMHHRCWPGLSREFERTFKSGCERWGLTPVQYGAYSEPAIVEDLDDRFDFHILQMRTAKRLGFDICRIQTPGCDPLLERLAPAAEKMKQKVAMEITRGAELMDPETNSVGKIMKIDSEWLGFNPDCNMFEDRRKERGGRGAAGPAGMPPGGMGGGAGRGPGGGERRGPGGGEGRGGGQAPQRIPAADYERLKVVMKWTMNVHGKFHWAEKGTIPAVPFDKITETLVKGGFTGWMTTEFEGGDLGEYKNSFEVVQVHHKIVKAAIEKYSKA